jgi:electron transfer flavoprotein alpha subunit
MSMNILVFAETADGKIRKTSLEAVAYAHGMGGAVTALVLGEADEAAVRGLGRYGAKKVLHAADKRLNTPLASSYANAIAQAMSAENANVLVLSHSSVGAPIAAKLTVRLKASLASNAVELPVTTQGFSVKRSIYTGKAFAVVELKNPTKIITTKKNAAEAKEVGQPADITPFTPVLTDADFAVKVTGVEKATGDILLPEAEIVVSGGRGMKGPEHWHLIENLAKLLGAATGCSKPVSDMHWRPHHEHVGQTGIKVAPQLYIAVGISGAIQHLAGVNSSKCIVVINKDPDAPFFKAADYGIAGDAFEVLPKLTEAFAAAR